MTKTSHIYRYSITLYQQILAAKSIIIRMSIFILHKFEVQCNATIKSLSGYGNLDMDFPVIISKDSEFLINSKIRLLDECSKGDLKFKFNHTHYYILCFFNHCHDVLKCYRSCLWFSFLDFKEDVTTKNCVEELLKASFQQTTESNLDFSKPYSTFPSCLKMQTTGWASAKLG